MANKPDLRKLPLHIIKVNSKWFKDTKTGKFISASRITDHLPKEEAIIQETKQYWWNNI